MNLVSYSIDSTLKEDHISNEYENYIKKYYYFDYKVKSVQSSIEYPMLINSDAAFLNCTDKFQDDSYRDTLCQLYYSDNQIELEQFYKRYNKDLLTLKITNQTNKSTLMLETYNEIKFYDVNSKYILIETLNGSKNALEIDSSMSTQTRNCNNEIDFTLTYIDNENVFLNWYVYGVGQSSGLWNLTSKTWTLSPSDDVILYFENKFIKGIYIIDNDVEMFELKGYEIYDVKGTKLVEFNSKAEISELLNSVIKLDSISLDDQFIITYKNNKKGLLKIEPNGYFYPVRILEEDYDEISVSEHSGLIITIKDTTIDFIKHNSYSFDKNNLVHYNLNAHKFGFSIYRQDYMFGDFNISNMGIIVDIDSKPNYNTKKNFLKGNHNFGYEKDQNHNFIIHNVKEKEISLVPMYSENGDNVDLDEDGVEDYEEIILPNISKSGVYSPQRKKWIINPSKNWIGEFNGNYLTSEYNENYQITYTLYNKNGEFITTIFTDETNLIDQIKDLYSADSVSNIGNNIFSIYSKNNHYIIDVQFLKKLQEIKILYKNDYLIYNYNYRFNKKNLFLCKNDNGYLFNWKNQDDNDKDTVTAILHDHFVILSNRDGLYDYHNSGDTLSYSFSEKSAAELTELIYNEKDYSSKLGKIKINDTLTLILNNSNTFIESVYSYLYDENGNEEYEAFISFVDNGKYSTGIFNDKSKKWMLKPQYEKIVLTEYGYTGIKREEKINYIRGDQNDSTPILSKKYSYEMYDKKFNLIQQFDTSNNPYLNPNNFKFLTNNLIFDSICELENEHLSSKTVYARQIANSKHYIYHNKEKGFGALSHWTDNNKFSKTENYFEAINYNPYFDCTIGVRSDSLFINDFSLKLIPQSTIEIFSNGGRNYHFNIRETLPNGVFEYTFDEENKKWVKKVTPIESSFGITDRVYIPPIASISIYENEIIINHLNGPIEEVTEGDMYVYNDYYEYITTSYHGKTSNDEVWKKINGQWKEIISEGTITKCEKGYLLIKPKFSQSYFNNDPKETSLFVDHQLKPIQFEKYANPFNYFEIGEGYYVISFYNIEIDDSKIVCFSPTGKVISDAFHSFQIVDGKIKAEFMLINEYGDIIEERIEMLEMVK